MATGTCGTGDTTFVDITTSASNYISSGGAVKAQLVWIETNGYSFNVKVDKIEFGVR